MSTEPTLEQTYDRLETRIRAEADAKLATIRQVAAAHHKLHADREAFAATDTANLKALAAATKAAHKAGFTAAELRKWGPTPARARAKTHRTASQTSVPEPRSDHPDQAETESHDDRD